MSERFRCFRNLTIRHILTTLHSEIEDLCLLGAFQRNWGVIGELEGPVDFFRFTTASKTSLMDVTLRLGDGKDPCGSLSRE